MLRKIRISNFEDRISVIFLALFLILYIKVLFTVLVIGEDGTIRSILKGWGDIAYHLNLIETLSVRGLTKLDQPAAAGVPLNYPFFINWLSALLRKFGFSIYLSFHIPAIFFGIILFFSTWFLGKALFSRSIFALALVAILFFGGGIGFWQFFKDLKMGEPFSHEYTHLDNRTGGKLSDMDVPYNIIWIVPAISFFSHQRSFIPGAALGILILLGLYRKKFWWIILSGFMPIIHTHTYLVFAVFLFIYFLICLIKEGWKSKETKVIFIYGLFAALVSIPQVFFLMKGKSAGGFFEWWPGWMARNYENVVWFWTKNFGVLFWGWVIVMVFGMIRLLKKEIAKDKEKMKFASFWSLYPENSNLFFSLIIASVIIFAAANLVKLQPWEFDNNKIFLWWWVFATILILIEFKKFLEKYKKLGTILFFIFLILATFSGFLDVAGRFVNLDKLLFGYYGKDEVFAADWIRKNTSPDDVFLTSTYANVFVPMLTGRRIYFGFPGWLWSHGNGRVIEERRPKIEEFLKTGDQTTLCKDGVKYILWDDGFVKDWQNIDMEKVGRAVEEIFNNEGIKIYKIKC
jgi:hypothetical protein